MNTPKIQPARPLEGMRLLMKFVNGVEKIYDCNPMLHLEVFRLLNGEVSRCGIFEKFGLCNCLIRKYRDKKTRIIQITLIRHLKGILKEY